MTGGKSGFLTRLGYALAALLFAFVLYFILFKAGALPDLLPGFFGFSTWGSYGSYILLAWIALAIAVLALLSRLSKSFGTGMIQFGTAISSVVNFVLLLIVYIAAVGPTSVIAKLTGKRFLELMPGRQKSYWHTMRLSKRDRQEYYRQF